MLSQFQSLQSEVPGSIVYRQEIVLEFKDRWNAWELFPPPSTLQSFKGVKKIKGLYCVSRVRIRYSKLDTVHAFILYSNARSISELGLRVGRS